ncbi:MAG: M1 family aminopeptidase [Calditrichia bacterium]
MKKFIFFIVLLSVVVYGQHYKRVTDIIEKERTSASRFFNKIKSAPDQKNVDAVYYKLDLTMNMNGSSLTMVGDVTGRFKSKVDGLTEIKLDFVNVQDGGIPWDNFSVSGPVANYTHQNDVITIQFLEGIQADSLVEVTIHYEGYPSASGFQGFDFNPDVNGHPLISTLSEPYLARTWWPCIDNPRDKADSVDIILTVPANMIAASNGSLVDTIYHDNNMVTYVWEERYPITTYLVSLAISEYSVFTETWNYNNIQMPLMYFVLPEDRREAQSSYSSIKNMMTAFSEYFGIYPFYQEKYGQAYFTWGGGMEHQTLTSIGSTSRYWEYIYAHELGHQWFGDLVTCENWHEIWMNEGFASYTEALWEEYKGGKEAYLSYIQNNLSSIYSFGTRPLYVQDTTKINDIFHWTVYEKGMWVLHMLRHVVGEENFFHIMQQYPNDPRFAFSTVNTTQFKEFCEEVTGMDLDTFFSQWVYYGGFPIIDWNWRMSGDDTLTIAILQKQSTEFTNYTYYEMPVPFELEGLSSSLYTVNAPMQAMEYQEIKLPVSEQIVNVNIDPEKWVLMISNQSQALDTPGGGQIIKDFRIVGNFPNPFNPSTQFLLNIPEAGNLEITIYDVSGREIFSDTRVISAATRAYSYLWDGVDKFGKDVSSGIYLAGFKLNNHQKFHKVIKIK